MYEYLDKIKSPADIKGLTREELVKLSGEIRDRIINVTSRKGGHLAASLGAVELAVAVHYCIESPNDKIVWDVGHQSYAHKILTGRNKDFETLREMGGMSGFPNRNESEHDPFTTGHSSTSISSALGLACARDLSGEDHKVVAVVGDAALSTGLAFEGINHLGNIKTNLTVILNDNEHSISRPVGSMSKHLNKVLTNPLYNRVRHEAEKVVKSIPKLGYKAYKTLRKMEESVKHLLVPGILFEELGLRYVGPIDGHNIDQLINILTNVMSFKEPVLVHAITKKGKGYKFAEEDPTRLHGISYFDIGTGDSTTKGNGVKTYTEHFGEKIVGLSKKDKKIVAITAAMKDGVGLRKFAEKYPDRFFDVGINEAHAVTFAAGLARGGFKPVVAIYSTFLQRAYDQLIHDVALQGLPVVFCLDRCGLVGKDGPTHHGVFDISYTRSLPGFIVMAPKDGFEFEVMIEEALKCDKPVVIRYPRGYANQLVSPSSFEPLQIGRSERLRDGKELVVLALGSMVNTALRVAELFFADGKEVAVINARFAKPVDRMMLEEISREYNKVVTLEEGVISGGFGSAVLEFFERENIKKIEVECLGLPDEFIEHGSQEELLRKYHLTPDEIFATIKAEMFA